jgi:hypothetical protein
MATAIARRDFLCILCPPVAVNVVGIERRFFALLLS